MVNQLPTFEKASMDYLLDCISILDGLDRDVKRAIAACCVKSDVIYPGETIQNPLTQQPADAIFVIAGLVERKSGPSGSFVSYIGPGDGAGGVSLVTSEPHNHYFIARSHTLVLFIQYKFR